MSDSAEQQKKKKGGRTAADRRRIQGAKHEEVEAVEVKGNRTIKPEKSPFSEGIGQVNPQRTPLPSA
jgi:hypothetical protein